MVNRPSEFHIFCLPVLSHDESMSQAVDETNMCHEVFAISILLPLRLYFTFGGFVRSLQSQNKKNRSHKGLCCQNLEKDASLGD